MVYATVKVSVPPEESVTVCGIWHRLRTAVDNCRGFSDRHFGDDAYDLVATADGTNIAFAIRYVPIVVGQIFLEAVATNTNRESWTSLDIESRVKEVIGTHVEQVTA